MDNKLTLKLNQDVIARAKEYASERGISLSRLIEAYLATLTKKHTVVEEPNISPFVKSMATGVKLPADLDEKQAYADFSADKHQ